MCDGRLEGQALTVDGEILEQKKKGHISHEKEQNKDL